MMMVLLKQGPWQKRGVRVYLGEEKSKISEMLVAAKFTACLLEKLSKAVAENPTECEEYNRELDALLLSSAGALLRWRLMVGEAAGLIKLNGVKDWEPDEFD